MWIPLEEVVFDNTIQSIHCDTRDFNCNIVCEGKYTRKLTEGYCHSIAEVGSILKLLKAASGGNVKWRMLSFCKDKKDVTGWDWKYIRIYKTEKGYGISSGNAVNERFVNKKFFRRHIINHKYLNAY